MAKIPIERTNGADGDVEVSWETQDMTAKSGRDYCGGEGVIRFTHGETTKNLEIVIYDDEVSVRRCDGIRQHVNYTIQRSKHSVDGCSCMYIVYSVGTD